MKTPLCPGCRHKWSHHVNGSCRASYSAGPSGTFRCGCERVPPAPPVAATEVSATAPAPEGGTT